MSISKIDGKIIQPTVAADESRDNSRLPGALSHGTGGNGTYTAETKLTPAEIEKRQKAINQAIKEHAGTSEKTYLDFIQKRYGYTKETFLELDKQEFARILNECNETIEESIDAALSSSRVTNMKAFMQISREAAKVGADFELASEIAIFNNKKDIKNVTDIVTTAQQTITYGANLDTSVSFASTINGQSLLEIINGDNTGNSRKYTKYSDLPRDEFKTIIQNLVNQYSAQNSNDPAAKLAVMRSLIERLGVQDETDVKFVYDVFCESNPDVKQNFSLLESLINNFNNNPEALNKFLSNGYFNQILLERNFSESQVNQITYQSAGIMYDGENPNLAKDSIDLMNSLSSYGFEKYYDELKKQAPNTYTQAQKDFIADVEKYQTLKAAKKNGTINAEQEEWLNNFSQRMGIVENLGNTYGAAIATYDESGKLLQEFKELCPDRFSAILDKFVEYVKTNPDIKFDQEFLDNLTDGKFSEKLLSSSAAAGNSDSVSGSGFGFANKPTAPVVTAIIPVIPENNEYTVVYDKKDPKINLSSNNQERNAFSFTNLACLSEENIRLGLKLGFIKVSEIYQNCKNLSSNYGKIATELISRIASDNQKILAIANLGSNTAKRELIALQGLKINPEDENILGLDAANRNILKIQQESLSS